MKAFKYYLRGFEEGSILSATNLGRLLIDGDSTNGIESDFKEGMKYLKFASENGDTDAMFYYSINIANSESTSEELSNMEKYLKKGVFLKDKDLIGLYGGYLSLQKVLPQNKVKAARYFKMSADLGNAYAMKMYAKCLSSGFGVEKNKEESLKYFKKSEYIKQESIEEYVNKNYNLDEFAIKIILESGEVNWIEVNQYLDAMNQKHNENNFKFFSLK